MGSMITEKVIVPSVAGTLILAPVELSWFDARQGRYRIARTQSHELIVTPSDLPNAADDDSGFLRNEIARLGQDLAFIHRGTETLRNVSAPLVASVYWWAILFLPAALVLGWRLRLSRLSADRRDPAGRRLRLALASARKELKKVSRNKEEKERLDSLARIVTRFVADCTGVPTASVGVAEVRDFCATVSAVEAGEQLVEILGQADHVRYGGGVFSSDENVTRSVEKTLADLFARHRRNPSGRRAAGITAIGFVFLMFLATAPNSSAVSEDPPQSGADPVRLLAEGNQAYTEGDLELALDRYLEVRSSGIDDADLHFNLGNTHARRGELGKAVASYLRAKRLAPRDGDITKNLAWVRGHIKDLELTSGELPLFIAQTAILIGSLTLDEWSLLLVILVWTLAGLVGWAWFREDFGIHLRRIILGLAGFVLLIAVVVGWRYQREEIQREAVVVVDEAGVRSGPAETFPVLFQVHDGLTLVIESERETWSRIGLGGDWVGWVESRSLEEVRGDRERQSSPDSK